MPQDTPPHDPTPETPPDIDTPNPEPAEGTLP